MPIENDQELTAYEVGVRISQSEILSNPDEWTVLPAKPTLVSALSLLSTAMAKLSRGVGEDDVLLEQCQQLLSDAFLAVSRLPNDLDGWCHDGFHHCNRQLASMALLLGQFLAARSHARNKLIEWYRLGREIPRGEYVDPSDVPPGCTRRCIDPARWVADNHARLEILLDDVNVEITYVFPEIESTSADLEPIPDLPPQVCRWDSIESGLVIMREDGRGRSERPWDDETESRNRFIYERCCAGIAHSSIRAEVNRRFPGAGFDSINGIRNAANRYAKVHNLAPPPPRKGGRRKGSN